MFPPFWWSNCSWISSFMFQLWFQVPAFVRVRGLLSWKPSQNYFCQLCSAQPSYNICCNEARISQNGRLLHGFLKLKHIIHLMKNRVECWPSAAERRFIPPTQAKVHTGCSSGVLANNLHRPERRCHCCFRGWKPLSIYLLSWKEEKKKLLIYGCSKM